MTATVHEFRRLREAEARTIVTDLRASPSLHALAWRVLSGMPRHPKESGGATRQVARTVDDEGEAS